MQRRLIFKSESRGFRWCGIYLTGSQRGLWTLVLRKNYCWGFRAGCLLCAPPARPPLCPAVLPVSTSHGPSHQSWSEAWQRLFVLNFPFCIKSNFIANEKDILNFLPSKSTVISPIFFQTFFYSREKLETLMECVHVCVCVFKSVCPIFITGCIIFLPIQVCWLFGWFSTGIKYM